MKLLNRLERKYGKYAIHNLMKYVVALHVIGIVLGTQFPMLYNTYLSLNFSMIMKGQVWRLVTFIIPNVSFNDLLFVAITAYLYYMIGNALERAWGAFRFNLYFFSGILFNILAALLVYVINRNFILSPSLDYVYRAMFFAFAALYPNTQFLLFFLIPVKVKYLAWITGAYYIYEILGYLFRGNILAVITIVVSMANFLIFFFAAKKHKTISPREFRRKARYHRQMSEARNQGHAVQHKGQNVITRHKCAICGRTELDNDQLEFRFCSKCEGNYEYCMEHLFTHEHVKS